MTYRWSKTVANNANADPSINYREGQSPSSLNNSARAVMASVAKYRDDIAGMIATGGGDTAYTLSTNQSFHAPQDGLVVAFVPHATNGNNPTLNVDTLGAKPLRAISGQALGAGALIQGTPYVATYRLSSDEWVLHGFYGNPSLVPIGVPMPFVGDAAPNSNFALCYGQAISRSTYQSLFAICGTAFGVGDGTTTFNLPDLRGRAIFGLDNLGGSAANRVTNAGSGITGTTKGAVGGAQNVQLTAAQNGPHTHTGTTDPAGSHSHALSPAALKSIGATVSQGGATGWLGSITAPFPATDTAPDHSHGFTTASSGSGDPHSNMPPCIMLPFIIRVI